jgi:hypothetical protein
MNDERGSRIIRTAIHTLVKIQTKLFKQLARSEARRRAQKIQIRNLEDQLMEQETQSQRDREHWREFTRQNDKELAKVKQELLQVEDQLAPIPWYCRALICQNAKSWGIETIGFTPTPYNPDWPTDMDMTEVISIMSSPHLDLTDSDETQLPGIEEVSEILFATQHNPDLPHPWERQWKPRRAATPYPHGTSSWIRGLPASPIISPFTPLDYSKSWTNNHDTLPTPECPYQGESEQFGSRTVNQFLTELFPNYSLQTEVTAIDNNGPDGPKYNQFLDPTTGEMRQEWFPNPDLTADSFPMRPMTQDEIINPDSLLYAPINSPMYIPTHLENQPTTQDQ